MAASSPGVKVPLILLAAGCMFILSMHSMLGALQGQGVEADGPGRRTQGALPRGDGPAAAVEATTSTAMSTAVTTAAGLRPHPDAGSGTRRPPRPSCHWSGPVAGFLGGCAQKCEALASLEEAKSACLELPACGGVTRSGPLNFQLRQRAATEVSPAGETSYLKQCWPVPPPEGAFAAHEVSCETTAGRFTIRLEDSWSPLGVARFRELVDADFFRDQIFYRVLPGFLTQFGVAARPEVQAVWQGLRFADEPKKRPFGHGTVSFAGGGADSRSCHVFIAFGPNGKKLGGALHETPLGQVTDGIEVLDRIQQNYTQSQYPDLTHLQGELVKRGNVALAAYPKLDRILRCEHLPPKKH